MIKEQIENSNIIESYNDIFKRNRLVHIKSYDLHIAARIDLLNSIIYKS